MDEEKKDFNVDDEMPIEENVGIFDSAIEKDENHKHVKVSYEKEERPEPKKKKKGFMSDFISGVAAGAKVFSDNVKAGAATVTENFKGEKAAEEVDFDKEPEKVAETFKEETNPNLGPNTEKELTADEIPEPVADPEPPKKHKKVKKEDREPVNEVLVDDVEESTAVKTSFADKLSNLSSRQIIISAVGIIAVLVLIIILFARGCNKKVNELPEIPNVETNEEGNIVDDSGNEIPLVVTDRITNMEEAKAVNDDVVGWISIPGLKDVDGGICHDPKTYSYNKRDITGKNVNATYWINGAYYAHLRNKFGPSIDDLSQNTVVFGHSDLGSTNLSYENDDPTGPLFSQLFNFRNPDFAAQTPYIYLTTEAGNSVWEIFSVFYNDSSIDGGKALWYIEPEPKGNFSNVIQTMRERSLYNYDVTVGDDDKILTLSTCTVGFGLSSRSRYRFVIVAKLVRDSENLVEKKASFTINSEAPVPPSYQTEFDGYAASWTPGGESSTSTVSQVTDEGTGITITQS